MKEGHDINRRGEIILHIFHHGLIDQEHVERTIGEQSRRHSCNYVKIYKLTGK